MKRIFVGTIIGLGFTLFCGAQNQPVASNGAYRQEGIASWYGSDYDGRTTASGEIFNSKEKTASHPSLPFGTVLKVTNTQNGLSTVVRVNDRGPLKPVRIIDVSRAAAEELGLIAVGTAPVILESIGMVSIFPAPGASGAAEAPGPGSGTEMPSPGTPGPASGGLGSASIRPALPPEGTNKRYRIQVGAFKVIQNATSAFDKLKNAGLNPNYERDGDMYKVVLTGIRPEDVRFIAEKLGSAGFQEGWIREEP
ncbi:MAG: septal ring lytic transglycosylase RlpA family protein [Spirochaetaceae bacterium]|jgi:rare lipoprotein A|nr:septal ring lytic transglycosylase RlpA family protein [Spirochaetaceae bacterium]